MVRTTGLALSLCACVAAGPAWAHHGSSIFDAKRSIQIEGTVKDFQWSNPHSWVFLLVPDGRGGAQEAVFEGESPAVLLRQGWKANSFKPGDRVMVMVHPRNDGAPGGMFVTIKAVGGAVPAPR